nr:hypothetical protein [uncultured Desulfobacter sp.]
MKQIFEMAESIQKDAWQVVHDTNIIDIWSSIGATINLVGSLKMGLLINNNESTYAGHFETVAERITAVLTPEMRANILRIKNSIPIEKKVMGIQVYKAVIEHGIQDIDSFWTWKEQNPDDGIITWMP